MAASQDKEYTVTVTETKTWTVEVHASSSKEAKNLVEDRHETCEDYDEVYYDIEFEAESEDEEEVNETPRKKGDVTKMIEEAVKELEENVNIDKSLIEVAQELQAENDKLKEVIDCIIRWLDSNMENNYPDTLQEDSANLKEKIQKMMIE